MGAEAAVAAWPYKLLTRERHERLVDDLSRVAAQAGIPTVALDRSMAQSGCEPEEIEWVVNYNGYLNSDEAGGLILEGDFKPSPLNRMHAIAAAFIRNYYDARVVSLVDLIEDDVEDVDPRILLIPDFYEDSSMTSGAAIPTFKFQRLRGVVYERFSQRRGTVLHVASMKGLKAAYGTPFHDFLMNNWKVLSA